VSVGGNQCTIAAARAKAVSQFIGFFLDSIVDGKNPNNFLA
jgi:hypothetical protein